MKIQGFALLALAGLLAFSVSCKKESTIGAIKVDPGDTLPVFPPPPKPASFFFFDGKVDGRFEILNSSDTNYNDTNGYINFADSINLGRCLPGDSAAYFRQSSRFMNPLDPTNRFEIRMYECIHDTDTTAFKDWRYAIAETYPFVNEKSYLRGVELIWTDAGGVRWLTTPGSGNGDGSSFQITSVDTNAQDTSSLRICEGEFTGKLYNENTQNQFIFVNDAKFRFRWIRYTLTF